MVSKKKCPNCGNKSLELIFGDWVCHECEYHTHKLKKIRGSFR